MKRQKIAGKEMRWQIVWYAIGQWGCELRYYESTNMHKMMVMMVNGGPMPFMIFTYAITLT